MERSDELIEVSLTISELAQQAEGMQKAIDLVDDQVKEGGGL